ncbi:glycosyltransferase [Flavobacterium lindanitolerans]|uniref:Glycosyltransferase involved in cell wall biosynthesis n=1 Tax=Flavobacterium lindanitolerans TaxID=428988 RepID=A0A497V4G4_9FLAO|nr:glycosyltransferase [Flavobacterium lindanitolerans]PKW28879.1 glycosyltransferase involved in cell wall biosynthesis [Flavobacterium lindanitolerans]RLJ35618.1 glycosyltransferase involved in cell wall biosynthesis [Flavobacterium lindanitolerans]
MKRNKIVHILHSVGGVDVSLRLILSNINNIEFENVIIHGQKDTEDVFLDKNNQKLKSYRIPINRDISFKNDLKSIIQAYKIIKKEKPDLIHSHSAKGGIVGRMVGRMLGIKVLHTPQAYSYLSTENFLKRKVYITIEKLFANGNSILLASSNSEKNRAIKEVGYVEKKTILFNNSILPIDQLSELTIEKNWPDDYICTVGRPSFQKNIELMIQVLFEIKKHQKHIHLVLMGVGYHSPQLDSINDLISKLDLKSNITLLNWTNRQDIFRIINDSKLYISTARYEGLPYSIIESLALCKPCVVSDCDGNRDLIINDFNGFVIKDSHPESFSRKIIEILNNEELYLKFSQNAKKYFAENFNIIDNIKKLENIYKSNI